ncbi:MAG: phenylalanine--tRNA ligase subunit beta [Mycobacteriales bacterium]
MRVPLSWLRDYTDVTAAPKDIAAGLIRAGLEVEHVEDSGADVRGVVVGEVLDTARIEGSDKLSLVHVSTGSDPREIVCGASNFAAGDRVPVALPGAVLPGGFEIGRRKVFGHVSDGMLCSARELGLGEDHSGILVLDRDADLGADAADVLGLRDVVFDIAVTPDRGYAFSVRGIAREVATAFDADFADPGLAESTPRESPGWPVVVSDPLGCPRYIALAARGLDPAAQSPAWLRSRLVLTGMRPISLAVDVTNYVLMGLGQPLHAFDLARLDTRIVVRRAASGERLRTLDGVDRALDPADLLITDDAGPLVLAGIFGGQRAEVTAQTTDVLIEAAHFDPVTIGRSARRHGLSSEAAKRFERGVDPALPPVAAESAVALLARLAGARPDPTITDVDATTARESIRLDLALPGRVAGVDYDAATVRRRLVDVGCAVGDAKNAASALVVTPPPWRPDLTAPIDLVEEVIRLEGYDEVPVALPPVRARAQLTRAQRLRRSVGRAAAAAGYVEVTSYPWIGAEQLDALGFPADDERRRAVRLANPSSDAQPLLRTTLLPSVLDVLRRNTHRGARDVALFECAPVYLTGAGKPPPAPAPPGAVRPDLATLTALDAALPAQPLHLGAVIAGQAEPAGWWGLGRPAAWADIVELARDLVRAAGAADVAAAPASAPPWHPGRCAAIHVGGSAVGWAGELHPRVVTSLELPAGTCALELDLDTVFAAAGDVTVAPLVSAYPMATVDVALVVAAEVLAADVATALRAGAGELLEELRLFDVYVGPPLAPGERSLAYTLQFRAPDRTLTDAEVNAARDAAIARAVAELGATLRGG